MQSLYENSIEINKNCMKYSTISEHVYLNGSFSYKNSYKLIYSCTRCDKKQDFYIRKFRKRVLNLHNSYRNLHDTIPLLEDTSLNQSAQNLAKYIAQNGLNPHLYDCNQTYGENISVSYTNKPLSAKLCKSKRINALNKIY
jgi:hypothetical protein